MARWTGNILPALAATGLEFKDVGQGEWLRRLRGGEQDAKVNPTVELLDFSTEKYDNDGLGRSGLVFETSTTEARSKSIARGYDVVSTGLLARCVKSWRKDWV